MTDTIVMWLLALLPSVVSGMLVAYIKRAMDKHDRRDELRNQEVEARAKARKEESFLSLNLQMANAKMSYAVAMAIKRGEPNGEVEEGIEAYEEAKKRYFDFINRQATDHLSV